MKRKLLVITQLVVLLLAVPMFIYANNTSLQISSNVIIPILDSQLYFEVYDPSTGTLGVIGDLDAYRETTSDWIEVATTREGVIQGGQLRPWKVGITSANSYKLVGPGGAGEGISYRVKLEWEAQTGGNTTYPAGEKIYQAGTTQIWIEKNTNHPREINRTMFVEIPQYSHVPAEGTYTDTITFYMSAL